MSLDKRVTILEVQITGDPLNNDDSGIKGDIAHIVVVMNDVKKRLDDEDARKTKNNERLWRWGIGFILFLSVTACTYVANSLSNDSGNNSTNHSNNSKNVLDDVSKHSRRGENDNNHNHR
jgi:hypothetical protein